MSIERQEQLLATLEALRLHDANNTCMSVEDCADWLNCHKNTILRKIHSKKIKANFTAGTWRIPKLQFLEEIIEQQAS